MPLFRVRWTGADAEEGQWHDDPYGCFTERYFVNGKLARLTCCRRRMILPP